MGNPTKITERKLQIVSAHEANGNESMNQDEFDAVGSTVKKAEFDSAADGINSLAEQYVKSINVDVRIKLWSKLWDVSDFIFYTKSNRPYRDFCADGKYEPGEFLNEVFFESFDDILKSYVNIANTPGFSKDDYPFLKHFNTAFPVKVHQAYDNQLNSMPHDFIIANQDTFLYAFPSEEYKLSSVLKAGARRRVKNHEICVGTLFSRKIHGEICKVCTTEKWYEIYQSSHMKSAFVKANDVNFYDKVFVGPVPENDDGDSMDLPDTPMQFEEFYDNELFEKYVLVLLTLLQKLFQKKSEAKANAVGIQFSKYDCFQLFFTESLADNLKKIDGIMSLDSIRERDSIQAADVLFLDFILMGICRNFRSIARTPFRSNKQFGCTCRKREEELTLPVPYDLFGMYFRKVRGLDISQDSLRPRMSACWSEYSKLYQLLSNILIESYEKDISYEDLQKTFQDLAYESNAKAGTDKQKTINRSSAKHDTDCSFMKI